jgi:hypothetical protein
MSRHWEDNRSDGRLCLVIDPEDGTHPQRVYGQDKDEILEKMARTAEHATRHIAALKSQPAPPPTRPAAQAAPTPRKPLTADQTMQYTSDMQNPAKAPAAVRALVNEATGGALDEFEEFRKKQSRQAAIDAAAHTAMQWSQKHPEFPNHPANQKMLMDSAALRVGLERITEDVLQSVFLDLMESGMIIDSEEQQPPARQPGETPAPRQAGTREATSYRRTSLRAATPQPAAPQARYTRAQIDAMSSDDLLTKMRTEPGFTELVDQYSKPRQARA